LKVPLCLKVKRTGCHRLRRGGGEQEGVRNRNAIYAHVTLFACAPSPPSPVSTVSKNYYMPLHAYRHI
jgi:hypothetical protein